MTTYGQSIFCIIATWAQGKKWQRCIGPKWPMDQLADSHLGLGLNGRQPFGVGLDGRVGQLRPVTSPAGRPPVGELKKVGKSRIFWQKVGKSRRIFHKSRKR